MNWINKREILIKSFLIDSIIVFLVFIFCNKEFYLNLNLIKNLIIAFEWVILSYIFDRYYDFITYKYLDNLTLYFINFVKTLFISSLIFISLKVLTVLNIEFDFFHIYNLYFILFLSIISSLLNFLFKFIYSRKRSRNQTWLFIGSNQKLSIFRNEIKVLSQNIVIKNYPNEEHLDPYDFKYSGIIVDLSYELNLDITKELKILKNKGIILISLEIWCDKYLERYPIDLIHNSDLLLQDLGINKFSMQFRIKRLADVFVSLFLAIITSPIVLICSILIYLQDRGPIFYKQIRNGQYENKIEIIKLRTMNVNAEQDGPQWSKLGDSRITNLGKILRRSRIDELPQLLSVLKGDMSLIGPRPERPEIDNKLKDIIPNYSLRYTIRPGLSGWAQVNFPYGASISDSRMKFSYDIYYLKKTSIILDFLICIRTIRLVFNAKGATPRIN